MTFAPLPATACWQHRGARSGFEVAYFRAEPGGCRIDGTTTAVEDAQTWIVTYSIQLDAAWLTRDARIAARTASGLRETVLACDGEGRWRIDGHRADYLDGCLDIDLESSALTNTLPVHRLELAAGARAETPAAYIRAFDLSAERLEQSLCAAARRNRAASATAIPLLPSTSPGTLVYDQSGLVLDYPGIAVRVL